MTAFLAASVVALFKGTIEQRDGAGRFHADLAGMGGICRDPDADRCRSRAGAGRAQWGDSRSALAKEATVGLGNGLALGAVAAGVAWLTKGDPMIGLLLGMAMVLNMFVAATAGTLIPLGLKALKVDPALGSSVFITTLFAGTAARLYAYEAHASASDEPTPEPVLRAVATARHHLLHDPITESTAATVDRTGRTLVRGTEDGRVELVDLASLARTPLADLNASVDGLGVSASDDRVVVQTRDEFFTSTLSVWDMGTMSTLIDLDASDIPAVRALAIAGAPGVVAAIAQDPAQSDVDRLVISDATTGARLPLPEGDGREVRQLALSPDGTRLAASDVQAAPADRRPGIHVSEPDGDGWIDITPRWQGEAALEGGPGLPGHALEGGLAFDGTGDLLAYGTVEVGLAAVATVATGAGERLAAFGDEPVDDVAFLPDGRLRALSRAGSVSTFGRLPDVGWDARAGRHHHPRPARRVAGRRRQPGRLHRHFDFRLRRRHRRGAGGRRRPRRPVRRRPSAIWSSTTAGHISAVPPRRGGPG